MKKENANKMKLLLLWEMLSTDSDGDNPLSTNEILERLRDRGISCDRRTLYNDIRTLNEFDFEVLCELKNHSNHYYVAERGFDTAELKILMDAVTAAQFITQKKTRDFHKKIAYLAGANRGELLTKSQDSINLTKSHNEGVYRNVSELEEAILAGKKVSFEYFSFNAKGEKVLRREGEPYLTNPVATVFSSGYYYLVAFSPDREILVHFRIDKMQHVNLEEQDVDKPSWLTKEKLAEHKKQLFSMYGGNTVNVTFEADNSIADVIFDKFGSQTYLKDLNNGRFACSAEVQTSPTFFGWALSFGGKLKVVSPDNVVNELKQYLTTASELY